MRNIRTILKDSKEKIIPIEILAGAIEEAEDVRLAVVQSSFVQRFYAIFVGWVTDMIFGFVN